MQLTDPAQLVPNEEMILTEFRLSHGCPRRGPQGRIRTIGSDLSRKKDGCGRPGATRA